MNSIRPSFAERDAFRELLSSSYADGRLDDEQFRRRQDLLEEAVDIDDLLRVAEGLPLDGIDLPQRPRSTNGAVRPRQRLRRSTVAAAIVLAAAIGFVSAGGIGKLLPEESSGAASHREPDVPSEGKEPLRAFTSGGLGDTLDWLERQHYTRVRSLTIFADRVQVLALAPGRGKALDSITFDGGDAPDVSPYGVLSSGDDLFGLRKVDFSVVPAAIEAAPGVVGSAGSVSHVAIDRGTDGKPEIQVFVEGDEYGEGSGNATWNADGTELLAVSRAE